LTALGSAEDGNPGIASEIEVSSTGVAIEAPLASGCQETTMMEWATKMVVWLDPLRRA
jgi:hypothetical protein